MVFYLNINVFLFMIYFTSGSQIFESCTRETLVDKAHDMWHLNNSVSDECLGTYDRVFVKTGYALTQFCDSQDTCYYTIFKYHFNQHNVEQGLCSPHVCTKQSVVGNQGDWLVPQEGWYDCPKEDDQTSYSINHLMDSVSLLIGLFVGSCCTLVFQSFCCRRGGKGCSINNDSYPKTDTYGFSDETDVENQRKQFKITPPTSPNACADDSKQFKQVTFTDMSKLFKQATYVSMGTEQLRQATYTEPRMRRDTTLISDKDGHIFSITLEDNENDGHEEDASDRKKSRKKSNKIKTAQLSLHNDTLESIVVEQDYDSLESPPSFGQIPMDDQSNHDHQDSIWKMAQKIKSPRLNMDVPRCCKIGAGRFGSVYEVKVALKESTTHLARFKEEEELLKDINHPNVCSIAAITIHNKDYEMMPYYPDGDLLRLLETKK